jgi:hypothetical protein
VLLGVLLVQAAVLPALQSAVAALDSLNKTDIIEMRTFIKPPALVQLTMEGVCILLQVCCLEMVSADSVCKFSISSLCERWREGM